MLWRRKGDIYCQGDYDQPNNKSPENVSYSKVQLSPKMIAATAEDWDKFRNKGASIVLLDLDDKLSPIFGNFLCIISWFSRFFIAVYRNFINSAEKAEELCRSKLWFSEICFILQKSDMVQSLAYINVRIDEKIYVHNTTVSSTFADSSAVENWRRWNGISQEKNRREWNLWSGNNQTRVSITSSNWLHNLSLLPRRHCSTKWTLCRQTLRPLDVDSVHSISSRAWQCRCQWSSWTSCPLGSVAARQIPLVASTETQRIF